jgi:inward rectifier potassium channel
MRFLAERTQFRRDRVVVPIARKHLLPDPLFFRCIFSGRSRGVNGTTRFVGLRQAVGAMSFRDEVQPAVPVLDICGHCARRRYSDDRLISAICSESWIKEITALSKLQRKRSERNPQVVRLGHREIETLGLSQGFWSDLYHRSMTVYWPVFFGSAAAMFVALNAVFGFLYSLGHDPIANAAENGPLAYFYFSIETLATVGYGDMHPQSNYGHLIATIEIFTGMSFLAVMTGLIFARFSRPRARFVFANNPVITRHEGQQTLMIRMANARHNAISRANARMWIMRVERTKQGDQLRRFYELRLDRSEHPVFILSWMLFHVIDKDSPLRGLTASDLTEGDALLVLNVGGVDDSSAQQLYARHVYSWRDIRWQHRYKDITRISPQGRILLDYTKFHDTVREE